MTLVTAAIQLSLEKCEPDRWEIVRLPARVFCFPPPAKTRVESFLKNGLMQRHARRSRVSHFLVGISREIGYALSSAIEGFFVRASPAEIPGT